MNTNLNFKSILPVVYLRDIYIQKIWNIDVLLDNIIESFYEHLFTIIHIQVIVTDTREEMRAAFFLTNTKNHRLQFLYCGAQ